MTITRPPRYWHGGVPGLKPGDLLIPQPMSEGAHLHPAGECAMCDARRSGRQLDTDDNDPTMVYVTTDRDYARLYASGYRRGDLYVVEPLGDMVDRWRDGDGEDCAPSWGVGSARVLSVYERTVQMTEKEARRLQRRWGITDREARAATLGILAR